MVKEVYAEAAAKAAELAGAATVADVVAGNATEAELVQLWKLEVLRGALPHLREAADALGLHELSMGMTDDFEVAIEEGATHIRVGRAVFGERTQQ